MVLDDRIDTGAKYRFRAEELRTLATDMRSMVCRATMLRLADEYDKMSVSWEQTHALVGVDRLAVAH